MPSKLRMGAGMASGIRNLSNAAVDDRIRNIHMQGKGQLGIQIGFAQFFLFFPLRSGGQSVGRSRSAGETSL